METKAFTQDEIIRLRAETKGTAGVIHFNNAGASLPPDVVVDSVINYLKEEAVIGGYETEFKYKDQLEGAYDSIARLINCSRDEVAIVENASTAWGLAFNGIHYKKGDVIITSEMEYVTNLIGFLNVQKNQGVEIKVIPNDEHGNFSLLALEEAISPQTKLIALTHIASTSGVILPVVKIGKIASRYNILYLVDASQSAGQIPVDVQEMNCDMLSVTGRKYLRAPRGTGFLFVKKEIQNDLKLLFADGFTAEWVSKADYKIREDGRRFELYEKNRALVIGLGNAVEYALQLGIEKIWQRIQYLVDLMRRELQSIEGVTVHDHGSYICGIITFSVKGIEDIEIKNKLFENRINVSVGLAKSTPLYMDNNNLPSIVRASVHYYNTEEEIQKMGEVLLAIVGRN